MKKATSLALVVVFDILYLLTNALFHIKNISDIRVDRRVQRQIQQTPAQAQVQTVNIVQKNTL